MTRAELRENTFKLLFTNEFHEGSAALDEQADLFFDDFEYISEKNKEYIRERVSQISSKIEEIDTILNTISDGWPTNRMGKVELTILRLACFEMKFDEEIPDKVAVDQAVELAKKYGTDAAPKFVNGILAKMF